MYLPGIGVEQVSTYPTCTSVNILESQPDGAILWLQGWAIKKYASGAYSLMDAETTIPIHSLPRNITEMFPEDGGEMYGFDMHVKIIRNNPSGFYPWATSRCYIHYYAPAQGTCTCGAKHTSYPDRHYDWCDIHSFK